MQRSAPGPARAETPWESIESRFGEIEEQLRKADEDYKKPTERDYQEQSVAYIGVVTEFFEAMASVRPARFHSPTIEKLMFFLDPSVRSDIQFGRERLLTTWNNILDCVHMQRIHLEHGLEVAEMVVGDTDGVVLAAMPSGQQSSHPHIQRLCSATVTPDPSPDFRDMLKKRQFALQEFVAWVANWPVQLTRPGLFYTLKFRLKALPPHYDVYVVSYLRAQLEVMQGRLMCLNNRGDLDLWLRMQEKFGSAYRQCGMSPLLRLSVPCMAPFSFSLERKLYTNVNLCKSPTSDRLFVTKTVDDIDSGINEAFNQVYFAAKINRQVPALLGLFVQGESLVMVMEFVEGVGLSDLHRLPLATRYKVVADLIATLAIVHKMGAWHGDLQNDNNLKFCNRSDADYPVPVFLDLEHSGALAVNPHVVPSDGRDERQRDYSDVVALIAALLGRTDAIFLEIKRICDSKVRVPEKLIKLCRGTPSLKIPRALTVLRNIQEKGFEKPTVVRTFFAP